MVVSEQPTQHFSPELGLGTVVNATDVVDALTVGGLLDLGPGSRTYYVGARLRDKETPPVCAEEPVVDVVGVDRKLFDAANAAKARTHFCWGIGSLAGGFNEPGPGPKMGILGVAEGLCCVPPWTGHMLGLSPIFLSAFLYNTLCSKHKDMEFPPWAGAALVMTDKGVIGRRHFGPDSEINAILGRLRRRQKRPDSLLRHVQVHLRPGYCDPDPPFWDPLVCGLYFGLVVPCCRCICIQPKEPGLYRATIFSKHTTTVWTEIDPWRYRLEVSISSRWLARRNLRLAPRVEREVPGLIAATTVEHDFGVWCGRLGISTFRSDTGRAEVGSVKVVARPRATACKSATPSSSSTGKGLTMARSAPAWPQLDGRKRTVRLLIARGG